LCCCFDGFEDRFTVIFRRKIRHRFISDSASRKNEGGGGGRRRGEEEEEENVNYVFSKHISNKIYI
jgi:hypothetical protein